MRTAIRYSVLAMVIMLCSNMGAQHSQLISQYMFNGLVLNPAYTGAKNNLAVNLNYRNQWVSFEGAPESQIASIHGPLDKSPLSFGGMVTREKVGLSSEVSALGTSSYRMKMTEGHLYLGLGAGVAVRNSNWTEATIEEEGDPLFEANSQGQLRPIFSAGAYYQNKTWYLGYSSPSIMRYEYPSSEEVRSIFSFTGIEHMLTGGYAHEVNRYFVIKPSFLLRSIPASGYQFDLNTNVILRKKVWMGMSYRFSESVIAMIEYQINHQLRMGYSYDYGLGDIGRYSDGSHEVMLMWVFRKQSFARNPRYF